MTPFRSLLALIVLAALAPGCGGSRLETSLTLTATNPSVGQAVFRLECGPAGGDVPNPVSACAALAARPAVLLTPKPFTCIGGTFSWWALRIDGRFDGEPVDVTTSTCWTPQMELIRALGIARVLDAHLLPSLEAPFPPGSAPSS